MNSKAKPKLNSKTTRKNTHYKNKTLKLGGATEKQKSNIVQTFLAILNAIQLYHWKTKSYAQHKATDTLYEELSSQIDKFVEVLNGKSKMRISMFSKTLALYDLKTKRQLNSKLFEFRDFLIELERVFDPKKDSDLFSIRDDMLIAVNQFLYLLTLDK
jgi:DNA-binding ferritin-like protein